MTRPFFPCWTPKRASMSIVVARVPQQTRQLDPIWLKFAVCLLLLLCPTNRTKEIKLLLHHYEGEEIGPFPVVDEAKGEANSASEINNDFNFRTRRITMMNMAITVIAMRERIKWSWWPTSSNDAQIKDGKDRENDFHAKKLGTTTYRSTLMLAMVMTGVSIIHFAGRLPPFKILQFSANLIKKLSQFDKKTQDRSDKVESHLKPNPTQGPKAKITSNNHLSNW